MFEADAALAASEMQCANFNVLMQTGKDSKVSLINACKPIYVQLEVACSEASLLLKTPVTGKTSDGKQRLKLVVIDTELVACRKCIAMHETEKKKESSHLFRVKRLFSSVRHAALCLETQS